ncbi:MAG: globin [Chloroflexi bacterium]|nr:globin [Chloroflexota bacterium]
MTPDSTLFERVGGRDFFVRLIERFYESVAVDPVLRPIYPEDLEPPKAHLAGFLAQYWGGPPQYTAERGPPRLRMRHAPFAIGQEERDIWVRHMRAALESVDVSAEDAAQLSEYFEDTATFLMNRP